MPPENCKICSRSKLVQAEPVQFSQKPQNLNFQKVGDPLPFPILGSPTKVERLVKVMQTILLEHFIRNHLKDSFSMYNMNATNVKSSLGFQNQSGNQIFQRTGNTFPWNFRGSLRLAIPRKGIRGKVTHTQRKKQTNN